MTTLITGSSGYIGAALSRCLAERGVDLRGVDRDRPSTTFPGEFVHGDLNDRHLCARVVEGVDRVLHLAAARTDWGVSEDEYLRDNTEVTNKLVSAGRQAGVGTWMFYSSVAVLGPGEEARDETAGLNPTNPYGLSKARAEEVFHRLAEDRPDAEILILRPSAVFGPGHPADTNIYRLVEAIRRRRFVMVGDGGTVKTTSHRANLLSATTYLMKRMTAGVSTYIYVDRPAWRTGGLVRRIYKLLGRSGPPLRIPLWLADPIAKVSDLLAAATGIDFPITAARIRKFNRSTNFDASAIRALGFRQPVSNAEALEATVEWHLSRS